MIHQSTPTNGYDVAIWAIVCLSTLAVIATYIYANAKRNDLD